MNHLKEIRKKLGVSKWKLAQLTGLNWKTIHRIELNKHIPFERSKERIAKALGISVEDIFPPRDVEHILITKPRLKENEIQDQTDDALELEGYLLDKNFRRCPGVDVKLIDDKKKLSKVTSEHDGRFVFTDIARGKYQIVSNEAVVEITLQQ